MADGKPRWPDFLLIGAAKAGTTALFQALKRHPRVYLPEDKEPRYLSHPDVVPSFIGPGAEQNIRRIVWKQADYLALFANCPADAVAGEASPQYLADEGTPATAARFVPDAKLVVILRHPVERAYSQYLHLRQEGAEPAKTFEEAWDDGDRRIAEGWRAASWYAHRGFYAEQLTRWLRHFPRERLLVLFYEDWLGKPEEVLGAAWRHLGVEPLPDPVVTRENVSSLQPRWAWLHRRMVDPEHPLRLAAQRILPLRIRDAVTRTIGAANLVPGPKLDHALRARLARTYHEDIDRLEALTGRDLSGWRS